MMSDHTDRTDANGVKDREDEGFLRRLMFWRRNDPSLRESIEEVIEEHRESDAEEPFGDDERSMLQNLLRSGDLRVDDVMVPRADIIAVGMDEDFDSLLARFADAAHSRLPVFRGSLDDVIGLVHVKDIVLAMARTTDDSLPTVQDLMRPVVHVAPSMKLVDLLGKMRARRMHMAIVVDEYGGTDGLVTIEDLVEQIVGDIEDEHDEAERPMMILTADGTGMDADARCPLTDLERALEVDLLPDERDDDVDTIGGLVMALAGRLPKIGDLIEHESGLNFTILDADARRVKLVRVTPSPSEIEDDDKDSPK